MAIRSLQTQRGAAVSNGEDMGWAPDSEIGRILAGCKDDALATMCVTNVQDDADGGMIATGRLFSGRVGKGTKLHLIDAQTDAIVNHVYVHMVHSEKKVAEVTAGNILALAISERVKAAKHSLIPSTKIHGFHLRACLCLRTRFSWWIEPKDLGISYPSCPALDMLS